MGVLDTIENNYLINNSEEKSDNVKSRFRYFFYSTIVSGMIDFDRNFYDSLSCGVMSSKIKMVTSIFFLKCIIFDVVDEFSRNIGTFKIQYFHPVPMFINRVAGTMGAIVTCPLEVVKTRLQSSTSGFHPPPNNGEFTSGQFTCNGFPPKQQRRKLCTGGSTR